MFGPRSEMQWDQEHDEMLGRMACSFLLHLPTVSYMYLIFITNRLKKKKKTKTSIHSGGGGGGGLGGIIPLLFHLKFEICKEASSAAPLVMLMARHCACAPPPPPHPLPNPPIHPPTLPPPHPMPRQLG